MKLRTPRPVTITPLETIAIGLYIVGLDDAWSSHVRGMILVAAIVLFVFGRQR